MTVSALPDSERHVPNVQAFEQTLNNDTLTFELRTIGVQLAARLWRRKEMVYSANPSPGISR
jgi:hypothetical protein